ncbi:HAD superfamily hydrolase [Weissella halotolerans DSM 20190]|uniref:HAD superfamily hydrolase n=2 Tax=Weissella halotolerans TaxID=1615 RepID=A0A0R2G2B5_9LACO|nr:HAD superfamily hydrolase [Weissella halotolerans DSM 20190]
MLVSDLDETLLNNDGTINPLNVEAIKAAVAQGFKFVPNTGRSFLSVQDLLKTLGLADQADQYVISYNGGVIVENQGNRILDVSGMSLPLAEQIFQAGLVNDAVDVHIYTVDRLFVYNPSAADEEYMAARGVNYEVMADRNLSFLKDEAAITKVIFEHLDAKVQAQIKAAVLKAVGANQVEATFSSSRYVEFNPAGVDKGRATLTLGAKLGIKPEEIMAIGDNSNDLSMIKAAGLGISVANGIPAVKEAAQVVTARTNNQGAVAEVLERYVLKGEEA